MFRLNQFHLVLISLMISVTHETNSTNISTSKTHNDTILRLQNWLITGRLCNWVDIPEIGEDKCIIVCENADIISMQHNVRKIWNAPEHDICLLRGVHIQFINTSFDGNTIAEDWWLQPTDYTQLLEVQLNAENVTTIETYSFTDEYFMDLKVLAIRNMKVETIAANILSNLTKLNTLTIADLPIMSFDKNTLLSVNGSLTKLEIISVNKYELKLVNITGSAVRLAKLITLSIRNSWIKVVAANSLEGLTAVQYLELTNNRIEAIEAGAFHAVTNTIRSIDLRNNYLKSINGVFDELTQANGIIVHIGDNLWGCYPMDETLQKLMADYPAVFVDKICQTEYTSVNCVGADRECQIGINLQEMPFYLSLSEDDNRLRIQLEEETSNFMLLWTDTFREINVLNCAYSIFGQFSLENLVEETVYTICSMNKFRTKISPFDCLPYYHRAKPKTYTAWILLENKTQYIIIYVICCLSSLVFGFGVVYCLFFTQPTCLRGGTGVIIVRNRSDFLGRDEGSKNIATYLNLKCESNPANLYEISVTDPGLTRFEIVKWKLNAAQVVQSGNNYYWERIPTTAPPDPPMCFSNSMALDILCDMNTADTEINTMNKTRLIQIEDDPYDSIDEIFHLGIEKNQ